MCIKQLLITVSFHIMVLLIDDFSGYFFLSVLMGFGGVIGQFAFCVDKCLMPWLVRFMVAILCGRTYLILLG
jgi:hypothetical protein